MTIETSAATFPEPVASPTRRVRRDGALVGLVVGGVATLPLVVSWFTAGESPWWLLASLPAGIVAGAAAAPSINPGRRIAARTIIGAAATAFLVGDAVVCLALVVLYPPRADWAVLAALPNTMAMYLFGVITVGWLAMLLLVPLAAVGAFSLRAWRARGGAAWA
jgi:hypothetical protein